MNEHKISELLKVCRRLNDGIVNLLEIGKRDLSNPKYDGYFSELRQATFEYNQIKNWILKDLLK